MWPVVVVAVPAVPGTAGEDPPARPGPPGRCGTEVHPGTDTDADGRADTVLTEHDDTLLVHTDLDGDGLADQVVAVGADGHARVAAPGCPAVEGGWPQPGEPDWGP